jgi:hypothetical protein
VDTGSDMAASKAKEWRHHSRCLSRVDGLPYRYKNVSSRGLKAGID